MPISKKKSSVSKNKPIEISSLRIDKELFAGKGNETETWRIFKIISEFVSGFELLRNYKKAASFFGSARCNLKAKDYQEASLLASLLAKDGYAVITGGASGIMEAANRGAFKTGGDSVGMNISLPHEQATNKYVTESENFHHFFVRKVMLSFASQVYIFFPGGFGTLDEFFEMITLVQTKKINPIPIILVGRDYWESLHSFIEQTLYHKNKTISKSDMDLYHIVDSAAEAHKLITRLVKIK